MYREEDYEKIRKYFPEEPENEREGFEVCIKEWISRDFFPSFRPGEKVRLINLENHATRQMRELNNTIVTIESFWDWNPYAIEEHDHALFLESNFKKIRRTLKDGDLF